MNEQVKNSGVEISPSYFETQLVNSQNSSTYSLKITNYESKPIALELSLGEFDQTPNTLMNYLVSSNKYKENIEPHVITVEAEQTRAYEFKVQIPQDCKAKETCNLALVLKLKPTDEETTTTTFEQAIPLYVTNTRNTEEDNYSMKSSFEIKIKVPKIIISEETNIKIETKNTGDTYTEPDIYAQFYNLKLLNNERQKKTEFKNIYNNGVKILPKKKFGKEIRYSTNNLEHIEIETIVEEQNQTIKSQSTDFWIIPPKFVIYTAVIIVLLTLITVSLIRFKVLSKILKRSK